MKTLLFATSNQRKLKEAILTCEQFDINLQQTQLEIDEIQSGDPILISVKKAESAFALLHKPVVVTDTYWTIPALKGFPGAYMKEVIEWFEPQDFIDLLQHKEDKRVAFTESITYIDNQHRKTFSKQFWGEIVDPPRGTGDSIEQVAQFDGLTLAQRGEKNLTSHKPEEYIWWDFATWFANLHRSAKI